MCFMLILSLIPHRGLKMMVSDLILEMRKWASRGSKLHAQSQTL